jgi:hypothetical protein
VLDDSAPAEAWPNPSALAGYTVGGIVGHVNVAVGWLEPLLVVAVPADARPIRPGRYYTGMKLVPSAAEQHPMHDVIREMSENTAARGHEANLTQFRALIERLRAALAGQPDDRLLDLRPIVPAYVRLDDFVKTRIVELVVHADDLAASVRTAAPLPEAAATAAIDALVATARAAHGDIAVLRALARRERSDGGVFPVF